MAHVLIVFFVFTLCLWLKHIFMFLVIIHCFEAREVKFCSFRVGLTLSRTIIWRKIEWNKNMCTLRFYFWCTTIKPVKFNTSLHSTSLTTSAFSHLFLTIIWSPTFMIIEHRWEGQRSVCREDLCCMGKTNIFACWSQMEGKRLWSSIENSIFWKRAAQAI